MDCTETPRYHHVVMFSATSERLTVGAAVEPMGGIVVDGGTGADTLVEGYQLMGTLPCGDVP
jgi:hypothetical protein